MYRRLSGDPDHEIHDELWTPDGRRVAVLECFTYNPEIFYCNAITPASERRFGAGPSLDIAKDWAERVVGLKPDRPLMPGYGIAK